MIQLNSRSNTSVNDTLESSKETNKQALIHHQLTEEISENIITKIVPIEAEKQMSPQQKTNHNYRPDIDGLRAVAILVVVIFHGWPDFMTGGYIGVDIFFVISGYLITGIIINQTLKNSFSYFGFYARRIRRIFPALIIVLVLSLLAACYLYSEYDLKKTAITSAASAGFGANIQRLINKDAYWDQFTKLNPLLHLWSLGVEEQFYLIWPFFICFIFKFFRQRILTLMIVFTILSFSGNIYCVYFYPQFAFYFPLCRFWQMSIGGIIAYLNVKIMNKIIINILSLVGVCTISLGAWYMNQQSLFPGWFALVPTLSAAAIISAGPQSFINKYILSSRLFVFVGKISYPLYLWHWPLLVYFRFMYSSKSQSFESKPQFLMGIAVLLSIITYYCIQNPIRISKSRMAVFFLIIAMTSVFVGSLYIAQNPSQYSLPQIRIRKNLELYYQQMAPQEQDFYVKNGRKIANSSKRKLRLPITQQKVTFSSSYYPKKFYHPFTVTPNSKYWQPNLPVQQLNLDLYDVLNEGQQNQIFVIGDSHAMMAMFRFRQLLQEAQKKNQAHLFPTILYMFPGGQFFLPCFPLYNFLKQMVQKHKPKKLLFVNNIQWYMKNAPFKCGSTLQPGFTFVDRLAQQYKQFKQMGIEVYQGDIHPDGDRFSPTQMVDSTGIIQERIKPMKLSEYQAQASRWSIPGERLKTVMVQAGIKVIQFSDSQCWEDICQVALPTGYPIYRDNNHFLQNYVRYWLNLLDPVIQF